MFVITAKEIRLLLRSRRAFGFLMATLVMLGGIFCLAWASLSRQYNEFVSIGMRSMLGRQIFTFISIVQLCAMGLIAPLTAATAVSSERETGTLDLLVCTGLSRLNLLLGKWAATVYYEFVLLVCSLPVLALVFMLGGVGADEYLFSALLILASVLAYGMLGLAFSCLFRRSITALAATLLTVLFLSIGLPLMMAFLASVHVIDLNLSSSGPAMPNFIDALFWSVSPLVTWIHRIDGGLSAKAALFKDSIFIIHLAIQFLVLVVALWLARRAFVHMGAEGPGMAVDRLAETARRRRWPFLRLLPQLLAAARFVLRPILRPRPQRISDGTNPIYGRARSVYPWRRLLPQMGLFCVPIALMLTEAWKERDSDNFVVFTVIYAITLVGLFTPIFAATAVARERDEKTMDLLRVTPLSAGAIVRGKFFGALRPLLAIAFMAALIPLLWRGFLVLDHSASYGRGLVPRYMRPEFSIPAVRVIVLLFVFTAFYTAVSIYISTFQRRGAGAMTLAYIILFILAVLGPFALTLIVYEIGGRDWGFPLEVLHGAMKAVAEWLCPLVSPYYYLTMTNSSSVHAYVFWEEEKAFQSAGIWMTLHAGLVLGLTGLALRGAARRLARE